MIGHYFKTYSDEMLVGKIIITYRVTNLPFISHLDINGFSGFCIFVIKESYFLILVSCI